MYWHSELLGKDKNYHINKLLDCEKNNLRLITIFEDELQDYDKLKNRLKFIFKKEKSTIYARHCTIKEITSAEAKNFLEKTHIQNSVNSSYKIGAFFNDSLVAVMTFGPNRKALGSVKKDGSFELLRYAVNGNIPGIASKLFNYFIKNMSPQEITSYSDRRWNTGNLYQTLGFLFIGNTKPNYWYLETKNHLKRKHRFAYTKQKLIKMGGDASLTEWQNAQFLGLNRIWDCGSSKWVWTRVINNFSKS